MQSYLQYRRLAKQVNTHVEKKQNETGPNDGNAISHSPATNLSLLTDFGTGQADTTEEGRLEAQPTEGLLVYGHLPLTLDDDLEHISNSQTLQLTGTHLGIALTGVDVRSRTTIEDQTLGNVFVVGFDGPQDPENPHNWPIFKRIIVTMNVGLITWVVGLASAIDSAVLPQAAAAVGVSQVTESLATALFLAGIGFGAFVAGPISETLGRNPVYILSLTIYMLFVMGSGLSQGIGAQLACRFLAGFFGGSPFSMVGGSLADIFDPMQRMLAFPLFALFGFLGPIMGPIMGGYIGQTGVVSWRWVEWTSLIASGLTLAILVFFQPETYAPVILKWKARHLSAVTGDSRYVSIAEIRRLSLLGRLKIALSRPFLMTIQEPTIMLWTGYLTVIYIMLFGFLAGFSFIFSETYGVSQGITGVIFVAIGVGYFFAAIPLNLLVYRWAGQDLAKERAAHPEKPQHRLPPEFRLWYAMLGAPAIPISLFWMGWTAYSSISIWSPIVASGFFGYGILTVFISTYQYLIETYEIYAASALTMISLVRYAVSGGTLVAMIPIYRSIGVHWTLTWLALVAVVFTPAPYLFYWYGPWIRSKSKFAFK